MHALCKTATPGAIALRPDFYDAQVRGDYRLRPDTPANRQCCLDRAGTEQRRDNAARYDRLFAEAGLPAERFGTAEEFGATCAFLCSQHASFITGQNILMDGGEYPGTF